MLPKNDNKYVSNVHSQQSTESQVLAFTRWQHW